MGPSAVLNHEQAVHMSTQEKAWDEQADAAVGAGQQLDGKLMQNRRRERFNVREKCKTACHKTLKSIIENGLAGLEGVGAVESQSKCKCG